MRTLRITQSSEGPGQYGAEIALEGDELPRQAATSHFRFEMTAEEHEDLRWYLEDYLQDPHDPAPTIAQRVESWMGKKGVELFEGVLGGSPDARDLWAMLRSDLGETRVEIVASLQEAASIPWELLRDPKTDVALALRAKAFVRAQPQAAERPRLPSVASAGSAPIRILLVISRPRAGHDVPFRSVAKRLIGGLRGDTRALLQLDVLRPATFAQLARVLRAAKADGRPYQLVHFDGHGMYTDVADSSAVSQQLRKLTPLLLSGPREGAHGYLVFENPQRDLNAQLVDGTALGKLLVEGDVSALILNACRSAHAEPPVSDGRTSSRAGAPAGPERAGELAENPHAQVRAFGSLAQEVMDAGVAGVVAMRYNVFVVTAAQFVAELYGALTREYSLGEAVTFARKQLAANPERDIGFEPTPLQDWCVPMVFEAAPMRLFPPRDGRGLPVITLDADRGADARGTIDTDVPRRPDVGFIGRDETLLAIDRAFDSQRVVLLHAFAGSGKTAAAAEFARWYKLTGGVEGPVLFTSFERHKPLSRVLDRIESVFGRTLEHSGIHWLALDDAQRRSLTLQLLSRFPVLWIWDNVESIGGFPTGMKSAWSDAEQKELADFLRDTRETRARFLLTSRRGERAWLGDLPCRVQVPPMPMQDRVQLAKALAEKCNRRLTAVGDWWPLLEFTAGNPLTVTVVMGQALRDGLTRRDEIRHFVEELRAGEVHFDDEADEGRSKSLGASLSYGFKHGFNEAERRRLALLHFFQGFVNVNVLSWMGNDEVDWCLAEVRGLEPGDWIVLLDRAAEGGLLTAQGAGAYAIHPALPWFFRRLFDGYYPRQTDAPGTTANRNVPAARAFVEAMGTLGNALHDELLAGHHEAILGLKAEEANLLHTRQIARRHGLWNRVLSAMQGLRVLYQNTGRRGEWRQLVNDIVPDFIDSTNGKPLLGREEEWPIVTDYRVQVAMWVRQFAEAERLQRASVEWHRTRAEPALKAPPESLNDDHRLVLRSLVEVLARLGDVLREQGKSECVLAYDEAYEVAGRANFAHQLGRVALGAGHAYKDVLAIRDLNQAYVWYQRGLRHTDPRSRVDRAKFLGQLGAVALERFEEMTAAREPRENRRGYLKDALGFCLASIAAFPGDYHHDLAVEHERLGRIYMYLGKTRESLFHFRQSIQNYERGDDRFLAGGVRINVATFLAVSGRFSDALDYARAGLRDYDSYGDAKATEWAHSVIMHIERMQAGTA